MTMRILGGLGVVATIVLIALSARDSLSREAENGHARPLVYALRASGESALSPAGPGRLSSLTTAPPAGSRWRGDCRR